MFVSGAGKCVSCRKLFSFNPNLVPAIRVNGIREPICKTCVDAVNPTRIARGLEPIVILPGAYEAADEADVRWEA
jgi:hypothetical protein